MQALTKITTCIIILNPKGRLTIKVFHSNASSCKRVLLAITVTTLSTGVPLSGVFRGGGCRGVRTPVTSQ